MPVDQILQAVRDYLAEEAEAIRTGACREELASKLESPRRALRVALADYEAWRLRGRQFHRVLVAVDSSAQSEWAATVAGKLARDEDALVCLVHVVPEPVGMSVNSPYYPRPEVIEELYEEGRRLLARAKEGLPHGIRAEAILIEGNPGSEIVHAAANWHADLVVMGTHGRGALGRLMMGSVAEYVFRHAPCPVLTVRQSPASLADDQLAMEAIEEASRV